SRYDIEHTEIPDPEANAIRCMAEQIRKLEKKVESLEKSTKIRRKRNKAKLIVLKSEEETKSES
ncbi:MAG: hypothetical protein N3B13_07985, partial [Deltaproteobacteria bacterium]|nr:hypothetical protein [Deltaproteobacteria bacterium]